MNFGEGGDEAGVAFVGDDDDAAGFGDGDVGAGDAHFSGEKFGTQFVAGELDELRNIGLLTVFDLIAEGVGNFFLGHVDGGHDHVGRALTGELNDPFAEVGFGDFDAGGFEVSVEMDFLGGHGLGLDDGGDAAIHGEFENVLIDGVRIAGAEDFCAASFGVALEHIGEFFETAGGVGLDGGDLSAEGFEVDALVGFGAAGAVGLGEAAERAGEVGVVEGIEDGLLEFGVHWDTAIFSDAILSDVVFSGAILFEGSSSTMTMTRRAGPWTPMVRTRSMSAVRLGPVMKAR